MEDELLRKYKKLFSTKNLILKYSKWRLIYYLLNIIPFFIISSLLIGFFIWGYENFNFWSFIIVIMVICCLSFFILNSEYKKVIKEQYNINSRNLLWNQEEFHKYRSKKFDTFIKNEYNIVNQKKLEFLIELTEARIKELKPKNFMNKGIFTALVLPLWIQLIISIYQNDGIVNFESTLVALLLFCVVMIVFSILYFIQSIIYEFINSKYEWFKSLNADLKRLYFKMLD